MMLTWLCCMSACHARPNTETAGPAADSIEIKMLTKADFLTRVANFEQDTVWHYLGEKPAIIDFYADWCQPCKAVAPILEELARKYAEQIVVYKVNVDNENELAATFGISSIPSVLYVPMQGTPSMIRGAVPAELFENAVKDVLLKQK